MPETKQQVSILFVCMGNICRSPTGEGVFQHYVNAQGYGDLIHVDSAGTISYHAGNAADFRMRKTAARRGYSLDSIARQVIPADVQEFDLIIAMDHENFYDLRRLTKEDTSHIRLLGSFLGDTADQENAADVPDPYYGGADGFEQVLDMIEAACPAMLAYCLELHESK